MQVEADMKYSPTLNPPVMVQIGSIQLEHSCPCDSQQAGDETCEVIHPWSILSQHWQEEGETPAGTGKTVSCHVSVLGYCIFLRPSSSFSVLWLCRLHCTLLSALSIVGLSHHQLIVAQQNSHGVVETSEMVSQYKFFPSQLFFSGIFS